MMMVIIMHQVDGTCSDDVIVIPLSTVGTVV